MVDWIEGRVTGKRHWSQALYSLQIDAPLEAFQAGQYIKVALDVDGERVGRPYSLVNAPQEQPLEIYFNEIPEGPLTPKLSDLEIGDRIWCLPRRAASSRWTTWCLVSTCGCWRPAPR